MCVYLRASPPAAGPTGDQLTGDWQDWQDWKSGNNGRTGKTGSVLDRVILGPNPATWEAWGLRFGTPGHLFGVLGVPGDTLRGLP